MYLLHVSRAFLILRFLRLSCFILSNIIGRSSIELGRYAYFLIRSRSTGLPRSINGLLYYTQIPLACIYPVC